MVDSLPHLVKGGIVSTAGLEIHENMAVTGRVAGAFHRSVRGDGARGKVGLIDGGGDGYIRLVVRNFDRRDSVGKGCIRIVPEKWFDRRRQVAAVDGGRGGSVYGQARGSGVHAMVKN